MLLLAALLLVGPAPTASAVSSGPIGFGRHADGGDKGFVVRTTKATGPGSLADALSRPGRHITFNVTGTIDLRKKLRVPSNTTIDGRNANITVTGRPLVVDGSSNVVIRHLTRTGGNKESDDGIQVLNGARHVWLDHLTITRVPDEAIEISHGATNVTISWAHIHDQYRGILIGNRDDHTDGRDPSFVTVHNTWFENVTQRQPRAVRWAHVHAFNNVVDGWGNVAMSSAQRAQLLSERNIIASGGRLALVTRANQGAKNPEPGLARSSGDVISGGRTTVEEHQPDLVFEPPYAYNAVKANKRLIKRVRNRSGAW